MKQDPVHHIHIFESPLAIVLGGGITKLFCYQEDCYGSDGPSLSREVYPPNLIGPKLVVLQESGREEIDGE